MSIAPCLQCHEHAALNAAGLCVWCRPAPPAKPLTDYMPPGLGEQHRYYEGLMSQGLQSIRSNR